MIAHRGLDAREYRQCCDLLGIPSRDTSSPIARAEHVGPGVYLELLATPHAIERVRAWRTAGSLPVTGEAIVRRFRFAGSESTRAAIMNHLLEGPTAPAAVWHLLTRCAVFAIGAEHRGLCVTAPRPSRDRLILLADRGVDAEEITSVFLHELAHAFFFPDPPEVRDDLEDVTLSSEGGWWGYAQHLGIVDAALERAVEDERQAAALAKRWGAVGQAADGRFCATGPRRALERIRPAALPTAQDE